MLRISAMFIAICMVLIAGSIGAVLFLAAGLSGIVSALAALAALVGMMLYNVVANRLRDRSDLGDQIADLSRGTADLARQVAEIGRRLGAMENRVDATVNRARGAVDPIAAEIGELGGLVKQLAQTVAAHEGELNNRAKAMAEMAEASAPVGTLLTQESATLTGPTGPTPVASVEPAPAAVEPGELDLTEKEAVDGTRRFRGMSRENIIALIGSAVDANRIDL